MSCCSEGHLAVCPEHYDNWPDTKAAQLLNRQKALFTTVTYRVYPDQILAVRKALALLKCQIHREEHVTGEFGEYFDISVIQWHAPGVTFA